jgi:hypothetical protein
MRFTVEFAQGDEWKVVAAEVIATGARQAVERIAPRGGFYRAGPAGTFGLSEIFIVPEGGSASRVGALGGTPSAYQYSAEARFEAVREAAAVATERARLGRDRARQAREAATELRRESTERRRTRVDSRR